MFKKCQGGSKKKRFLIFTKNGRKMRQKWQQLGVCEFFFFILWIMKKPKNEFLFCFLVVVNVDFSFYQILFSFWKCTYSCKLSIMIHDSIVKVANPTCKFWIFYTHFWNTSIAFVSDIHADEATIILVTLSP